MRQLRNLLSDVLELGPDGGDVRGHRFSPGTATAAAHAKRMRDGRLKQAGVTHRCKTKVAPHVLGKIAAANKNYAVRARDRIDVEEKAPHKTKGRGKYKRWLPEAVARCCFGNAGSCAPKLADRPPLSQEIARRRFA